MVSKEFMSASDILWLKFSDDTKEILGELQHEILNSKNKISFIIQIDDEIENSMARKYLKLKDFYISCIEHESKILVSLI